MLITSISDREKELLRQYDSKRYSELYEEKEEDELYNVAKVLRNKNELPKVKLDINDGNTYNSFIYTKPKKGSPIYDLKTSYGSGVKSGGFIPNLPKSSGGPFQEEEEMLKKITTVGAKTIARTFDKSTQVVSKGIKGAIDIPALAYYNTKELIDSIKDDRDFNILNTEKSVTNITDKTSYIFGSNGNIGDYMDFRTSEEKRRGILEGKTEEQKEELKKLNSFALLNDVSVGILTGVGISKGLNSLVQKGGKIGAIAGGLQKTIDPSLSNMAKVGAVFGASALTYYGATGKWIFEGDAEANEGAGIVLGSLGLSVLGKGVSKSYNKVKEILSDKDFQDGVESFYENTKGNLGDAIDNLAEKTGVRASFDKSNKSFGTKERSEIYKSMTFIEAAQNSGKELGDKSFKYDSQEYSVVGDELKKLYDKGLVKSNGLDNGMVSVLFSDEAGRIRFGDAKYDPSRPIMKHYPPELWKKITGEDLTKINPIKEITGQKKIVNKSDTILDELLEGNKNNKAPIKKETFSEKYDNILGRFVASGNKNIGKALGDTSATITGRSANRTIQRELEGYDINGKIEFIKRGFDDVISKVREDEFDELNQYLFAKSRIAKNNIYKSETGKDLLTNRFNKAGEKVQYTHKEMEDIVSSLEGKYSKIADDVYRLNDEVLEFELQAGIRTKDEILNYKKTNPFYVPDRLDNTEVDKFIKRQGFKPEIIKLGKNLSGGTLDYSYNTNSIDNLYKQLAYRMTVANRNAKINVMRTFGEPIGIVNNITKSNNGKTLKNADDVVVEVFENGKSRFVTMPKFFAEELDRNDMLSTSFPMRVSGFATGLLKAQATGVAAPGFQLLAPTYEMINGAMKVWANGDIKDVGKYFKNIYSAMGGKNADTFINTKEGKEAIDGLMAWFGGDFSHIKLLKEESIGNSIGELTAVTGVKKWKKTLGDTIEFGSKIEKATARMPIYSAMLEKAFREKGIGLGDWNSMVKKAGFTGENKGSISKLTKLLEDKGISPRQAGTISKQVFNYRAATKTFREMGRIFPYLTTAIAGNTAIKQLVEDSPRKAITMIGLLWMAGDMIASMNSGTKDMFGILEEDEEKKTKFAQAPDYQTHTVGFLDFGDEEDILYPVAKNLNFLRWMMPLISEIKKAEINGEGIDLSASLSTTIQDLTYFIDLNNGLLPGVNIQATPPGFKQVLEVASNTDFFFGSPISKDYGKYALQDKEGANMLSIEATNMFAHMTGGKMNELGIMEGGIQISPKKFERMLKIVDPLDKFSTIISDAMSKFKTGKIDETTSKNFYNLFTRVYKSRGDGISGIYDKSNEGKEYNTIINSTIRGEFNKIGSKDELKSTYSKQLERFNLIDDKDEREKKIKIINNEVKLKIIELEYGRELSNAERILSADKMAEYYFTKYGNNKSKLREKLSDIYEANSQGFIGDTKINNFNKRFAELIKNQ